MLGHRNLWNKGVLHRNISINNIALGQDGARPGNTGVLIGLYHSAVIWESSKKLELADYRIVSRIIQIASFTFTDLLQ